MYLDHTVFKAQHDRQLLQWLNNRPEDWSLSWGSGATVIYGWGHNHRGQLGGLEGKQNKKKKNKITKKLMKFILIRWPYKKPNTLWFTQHSTADLYCWRRADFIPRYARWKTIRNWIWRWWTARHRRNRFNDIAHFGWIATACFREESGCQFRRQTLSCSDCRRRCVQLVRISFRLFSIMHEVLSKIVCDILK